MYETKGYAAMAADADLAPFAFARRSPDPHDVRIDILFCGICHTDVMLARNELGWSVYPLVPGHEIIGRVAEIGPQVTKFAVGDRVGVGGFIDSCRTCSSCEEGLEQFCDGMLPTYAAPDKNGEFTKGGYAQSIVIDENFVLRIPDALDLAGAAPLLCAGITVYSPLRHYGVGPGTRVGVIGLGGLGHMAVKLARAMGGEVVLFTTSPSKKDDALRLGASDVVLSTDAEEMKRHAGRLDLIIDTVAPAHDPNPYLMQLRRYGSMVMLGVPPTPHPAPDPILLLSRNRSVAGSAVGSIGETQAMLDFCAEKGIVSEIELIPIDEVNRAFDRMLRNDVRYRFVIDLATLDGASADNRQG
jgi:uncharacterized zinc-type alcohol dehydrogenase-like protein